MSMFVKPGTTWEAVWARARAAAPEAFEGDRIRNLMGGEWVRNGVPGSTSPRLTARSSPDRQLNMAQIPQKWRKRTKGTAAHRAVRSP